jgi:hypothetical protein
MLQPVRRLSGAACLVSFLAMAAPAQAFDHGPPQVLIETRFLEVTAGFTESIGSFDLDTNFGNGQSESFSRTREFVGIGIDLPVIDLGGPQVVAGADARVFLDTTMLDVSFDLHQQTPGKDVHAKVTNHVQVTPFVGVDFPLDGLLGDLAEQTTFRLFAGATIGDYKHSLRIDETGGNGNVERFTRTSMRVASTVGGTIVLGRLFGTEGVDVGAKLTGEVTSGRIPGLSGISGLGFAYEAKAREEARVGLVILITPRILSPIDD